MKNFLVAFILLISTIKLFSQVSNTWSVKFADAIKTRWNTTADGSGRVCIDKMTTKGWEYSNAIVLHGIEMVYNNLDKSTYASYRTYIQTYVNKFVNGSGVISQTLSSLDKLHPAILLLFLYEDPSTSSADKARYKTAADYSRNILVGPTSSYSKTPDKLFWHKLSGYDNIVMLDGMYMAHPFLAKYGSMFGDNAATDTAVNQILRMYNHVYDNTTHLVKHAWTSTPATYAWADATTGISKAVWSRAMGWFMMSLVDVLKYVPMAHPRRGELLTALNNLAVGMKNYQDATSGLWYQVVDQGTSLSGNYLETSGSAMFIYALKVAVDNGWIDSPTYLPVAQKGWTGLQTKISTAGDGMPQINSFAPAMSVLNGAAAYVTPANAGVSTPGTSHPHGYAAVLMAASAMEFSMVALPVKFVSFTAKEIGKNVSLTWQNGDENGVDHYEIQKAANSNSFTTIESIKSNGSEIYSSVDKDISGNIAYYRIKAVSLDGSVDYSAILSIRFKDADINVKVSPNPVKNGSVNLHLSNISPGTYTIKTFNSTGKLVQASSVTITGGISVQSILLPPSASKGIYYVQLKGEGTFIIRNLLVE